MTEGERFLKSYGTATSEKKAQKLELIISTACKLFADKDYQHVCMEEIAQTAGVGKGTIYIYFSSKEDLYFSIIRYRLSNLLEILEKAYSGRVDTVKNLRSFIIHIHKFMTKHPFFFRITAGCQTILAFRGARLPRRLQL